MVYFTSRSFRFLFVTLALVTTGSNHATSPDQNVLTGSKLTRVNYDQVTAGMTKTQVEKIMGPPTTMETKDMVNFKRTTYRYEDGAKFALFTFKNDELDTKDGNLAARP